MFEWGAQYKTFKFYGPQVSVVHDDLQGELRTFVETARALLVRRHKHKLLFCNALGQPLILAAELDAVHPTVWRLASDSAAR